MREGLQKIVSSDETIVAIATPPTRSALGVIRVSGKDAFLYVERFFRSSASVEHRKAIVGIWLDDEGTSVDEVVVTSFFAPNSYTGEHLVEISAHGNPVILNRIVQVIHSAGARLAGPGE